MEQKSPYWDDKTDPRSFYWNDPDNPRDFYYYQKLYDEIHTKKQKTPINRNNAGCAQVIEFYAKFAIGIVAGFIILFILGWICSLL